MCSPEGGDAEGFGAAVSWYELCFRKVRASLEIKRHNKQIASQKRNENVSCGQWWGTATPRSHFREQEAGLQGEKGRTAWRLQCALPPALWCSTEENHSEFRETASCVVG